MTITPEQMQGVWQTVQTAGRALPPRPESFAALLSAACAALEPQTDDTLLAAPEFALWAAACWLGPSHPPPPAAFAALRETLLPIAQAAPERLLDLVLAYGGGWRRSIAPEAHGWDGRWERALTTLTDRVGRHIQDAHQQLLKHHVPFPADAECLDAAFPLVLRLYRPLSPLTLGTGETLVFTASATGAMITTEAGHREHVPPGAKAVFSVRTVDGSPIQLQRSGHRPTLTAPNGATLRVTVMDFETRITLKQEHTETTAKLAVGEALRLAGPARLESWECTCGHTLCAERHRLASWNPTAPYGSLANFLAAAVKGPLPTLQVNSFLQGMLFAYWAREGF